MRFPFGRDRSDSHAARRPVGDGRVLPDVKMVERSRFALRTGKDAL